MFWLTVPSVWLSSHHYCSVASCSGTTCSAAPAIIIHDSPLALEWCIEGCMHADVGRTCWGPSASVDGLNPASASDSSYSVFCAQHSRAMHALAKKKPHTATRWRYSERPSEKPGLVRPAEVLCLGGLCFLTREELRAQLTSSFLSVYLSASYFLRVAPLRRSNCTSQAHLGHLKPCGMPAGSCAPIECNPWPLLHMPAHACTCLCQVWLTEGYPQEQRLGPFPPAGTRP